MIIKAQMVT